jgi:polyhydroxyalkanoate synthesis regulator phasin
LEPRDSTTTEPAASETARAQAAGVASTAADQSTHVASTAVEGGKWVAAVGQDEARQVASTAAAQAGEVAGEVSTQARNLIEESKTQLHTQARTQTDQLATKLRELGDQVQALVEGRTTDAGPVGDYARQAAQTVTQYADRVQQRGFDGIVDDVQRFARRKPGTFLLGAAVAGFGIGRLLRAGAISSAGAGRDAPDPSRGDAPYPAVGAVGAVGTVGTPPSLVDLSDGTGATADPTMETALTGDTETGTGVAAGSPLPVRTVPTDPGRIP